ncbi:MAG TPA: hypothetical protein VL551_21905 [Actinospica sp.]|nr:hypothetical protein [Actinospica sp.]
MRSTRRAATAAVSISLALAGVTAAHADTSTVLYVDGLSTTCTDSGTGTAAAPYCSIQPAADAAQPGDTVEITPTAYVGQLDIKSVGTAAAPIVFEPTPGSSGDVSMGNGVGQTGPVLNFDGAAYVSFAGAAITHMFNAAGVYANGSSHITLNGIHTLPVGIAGLHVTGTSSNISLTRSITNGEQIDSGSSDDVISTNVIDSSLLVINGAPNTTITSNTFFGSSAAETKIGITGGSTGTTIENNIVQYTGSTTDPAISVDSSSTSGSTIDYNVVYTSATPLPYSWGGTTYATAAALDAATGQGAHDINASPDYANTYGTITSSAPQLNSANSAAPGALSTDLFGNSCSADPAIAVTGAGSPAYCDRGAEQQTFSTSLVASTNAQGPLGVALSSSLVQTTTFGTGLSETVTAAPTPAVSYTINWGDGQTQTVQGSSTAAVTSTPHTYPAPGKYTVTDTANLTDGTTIVKTASVATTASSFTAISPQRIMDTRTGTGGLQGYLYAGGCYGLQVTGVDGIPAGATSVAVNLTATSTGGSGVFTLTSGNASNLNFSAGQTVANSAIVPLSSTGVLPVCLNGNASTYAQAIVDVTGYFTQSTGAGYQAATLKRILDTRSGTGAPEAKVGPKTGLSVPITGVDSIPAGATAVAVHVTETNATGNGWIAAQPDGAGGPTTSSLNYAKGQTISNTVIVPIAKDGSIELYNGSPTGSVDLIADVSGYFATSADGYFVPVTSYRAVDTRQTGYALGSDGDEAFPLNTINAGALQGLPAGVSLAVNLTATDETAGGSLIAYPAGTPMPNTSALNFGKGENVAGFGLFATVGAADALSVYNDSPGSTDLVADVFGYFTN